MNTERNAFTPSNTGSINFGEDLIRVHKAMTRGVRVATEHSGRFATPQPDPQLEVGLDRYVRALVKVMHIHHHGEDRLCWPDLRPWLPEAPYPQLMEEHGVLTQDLESAEAARKRRDWTTVHDHLDRVRTLWADHIAIEEAAFSPSATDAAMPPAAQATLLRRVERHAQLNSMPMALVVPFTLYNLEPADREAMAATIPGFVTTFVLPVIWKPRWAPMKPFLLPE